jgi:hypothetical protein
MACLPITLLKAEDSAIQVAEISTEKPAAAKSTPLAPCE